MPARHQGACHDNPSHPWVLAIWRLHHYGSMRMSVRRATLGWLLAAALGLGAQESTSQHERLAAIERDQASLPQLILSQQSHQRIGFHGLQADPAWIAIDLGRTVTPDRIAVFPARSQLAERVPSPGFPAAFDVEIAETEDFARAIRIVRWSEPLPGAGEHLPFLIFSGNGATGRFIRLRVTGLRPDPDQSDRQYFRIGEIVVLADGLNVALHAPVSSSASTESARRWERINVNDGYLWCLPLLGASPSPTHGFQSGVSVAAVVADRSWVEVDLGDVMPIDQIHLVPAHPRDFADSSGFGFPTHFRVLGDAGTPTETVILKELEPVWPADALPNPGSAQVMVATPGLSARRIRVSCQALWRRGPGSGKGPDEHVFALSELQVWRGRTNIAAWRPVLAADATQTTGWSPEALTDGYSSRHQLIDWDAWLDGIERGEHLREEAKTLRAGLALEHERWQQRLVLIAISAAVLIALLAAIALLLLRTRAGRERDVLRMRIARDLHDEIGAGLSHLAMQSDLAKQHLKQGDLHGDRLDAMSASARELIDHMRDIIWLLAPKAGDWRDLSRRMAAIADRLLESVPHHVVVTGTPPDGQPAIAWSRDVVSFMKEALTNARRHSQAQHVRVSITWSERLVIEICDDGTGFDVNDARPHGGSGLDNLRQRAAALSATLELHSSPGQGTRIQLSVGIEAI